MKLSTKLSLGFATLLALLLILATVAYFSVETSSNGFATYRNLARNTNLSGRLQADMLMVRMKVKNFIIRGSQKDLEEYKTFFGSMISLMGAAQQEITTPARARLVAAAAEHVMNYGEAFKKVHGFRTQRDHLVHDVLNAKGPRMEQDLTEILISAKADNDTEAAFTCGLAMRNLLLARLYVIKFLDDNSQTSIDRVHKEMDELRRDLQELDTSLQNPERRRLLEEVRVLFSEYFTAFDRLTAVIFERNDIITNTLDRLGPTIANDIEKVKQSLMSDQDTLGPKLHQANQQTLIIVLLISLFALVVGIGTAAFIIRSITRPLRAGVELAKAVASGDLTVEIDTSRNDEIGALTRALDEMIGQLKTVVTDVRSGSSSVAGGSAELSGTAQSLAESATEQASAIEEISASIEEMSSNISQNTENAVSTEKIASSAAQEAGQSGKAVAEAVLAMKDIAGKIGIIEEIARQTNLLALNAAIEAARAGENGKGFAVVAAEVRKLAERSGQAAGEISGLSNATVTAAEQAGVMLEHLVPNILKTAELVQEISTASSEQNIGAKQINKAINQLDTVIQHNACAAEEMASTSEELSAQSHHLEKAISFFRSTAAPHTMLQPPRQGQENDSARY
ncbi:methyl-accepting chemotaxis protein [Pseudodesulfovibrio piezophilus]|uniref:Methyl-accepting chemotaxis sensory transducer n=1 Tax=Pseudodesulfovibrio piezophilus (strain DSM 21447 / JCM 15486 / C1TLV30) TaxID=1322246 RepID=M1WM63_PSEP2|nr:methyl-accepting chemotaxis protein [Pseudodesulfovibrio piezophilus]CCH49055.1 Methyl-accepting chemotaxis sensory transducer [Pseudodesulfovibrio piezophilus C1TLV30]